MNVEDGALEALFAGLLYIARAMLPGPFLLLFDCLYVVSATKKQNATSLS